jgi:hypothetical protein
MGPDFGPCLATVDDEAEIWAGDFVLAHIRAGDEVFSIVKQIETYDGHWFLWARTGVTLLAGHQLNLAHIERVTKFEPISANEIPSMDLYRGVESFADIETQDHFTREARIAWGRYGFPRNVRFPGLESIYPHRGPEVRLPDNYVLSDFGGVAVPATNPTSPSVPQNVAIRAINGTLEFTWDAPVVIPVGTRYQIWSSVNCADATTGGRRWEGTTLNATLPFLQADISSGSFYWMRSISNSYVSAWTPSTYGTPATQSPPAEARVVISDPQFRTGQAIGSYWVLQGGLPCSLSPTGGPADGTGKITCAGTTTFGGFSNWTRTTYCARTANADPFAPCMPGQWLNWALTFRRTTTVASGVGGFSVFFTNRYDTGGSHVDLDIGLTFIRCDTLTVNQWTHLVGSVQCSALDRYNTIAPFLKFDATGCGTGTIEIGGFDAILR